MKGVSKKQGATPFAKSASHLAFVNISQLPANQSLKGFPELTEFDVKRDVCPVTYHVSRITACQPPERSH
jgi:hypothetical protein